MDIDRNLAIDHPIGRGIFQLIGHDADEDEATKLHGVGARVEEDDEGNGVSDEEKQPIAEESRFLGIWWRLWLLGTPACHGAQLGSTFLLDNVR